MKKLILPIVMSVVVYSSHAQKIMRYYKSEKGVRVITKELKDSLFSVNAFVLDPTAGKDRSVNDLSDRAQGALVEALSSKTKTPKELLSSLAMPVKEQSSSSATKGSIIWKKKIVLNIAKTDLERANRVQQIAFTIKIPEAFKGKVEFVSWDKIATETQVIDLGKVTSGTTAGFTLSPSITMDGYALGTLPAAVSGSKTTTAERTFTGRTAGLSAALISPTELQITRQSLPNEDISGNIVIEVTLKSNISNEKWIYNFDNFYSDTSIISDPSKIRVTRSLQITPGLDSIIPVDLSYKFRYRTVKKGKKTEPEYDDRVTYIDGSYTDTNKFNLFNAEEAKPPTWEISLGSYVLHLEKEGKIEALLFDSYSSAEQFLNWIILTQNLKVANYNLFSDPLVALSKKDLNLKSLQIRLSK